MDNASLMLNTLDEPGPCRASDPVMPGRLATRRRESPVRRCSFKRRGLHHPLKDVDLLTGDLGFWEAQDATNAKLSPSGLFITHMFPAHQVFLRPDWEIHLVPITRRSFLHLRLFRPATLDLVLTKMMRGDDAQDMADAAFLTRHDRITTLQLKQAFSSVVIPDLVELRDAFERAKPVVLKLAVDSPSS